MVILVEWDGVLTDALPPYHLAHRHAAAKVGWSSLDTVRFKATLKKQGVDAPVLPSAPPAKVAAYRDAFAMALESKNNLNLAALWPETPSVLRGLARHAVLIWVTLGGNTAARRELLHRAGVERFFREGASLDPDPRRRPGQLRTLAGGEKRVLLAAASEALIRAGGSAEMITAGFSCGLVSAARLQHAGADVVYDQSAELLRTLDHGAPDLVRAGMLPLPLGD